MDHNNCLCLNKTFNRYLGKEKNEGTFLAHWNIFFWKWWVETCERECVNISIKTDVLELFMIIVVSIVRL